MKSKYVGEKCVLKNNKIEKKYNKTISQFIFIYVVITFTVSDWQIDCESFQKNPNPKPSFHMFKLISKISLRGERVCQK